MRSIVPHILLALVILTGASCRREPIRTFRVAKESTAALPQDMGAGIAAPSAAGVTWEAPDGWEARAPNSVRIGSYAIPNPAGEPADFAITSFPGDVGGDLANVNRWRNQIGLQAVTAAELPSLLRSIAAPAGEFVVVNFINPDAGARLLAAFLKESGKTWFFKLTGPDAVVAASEPAFLGLLQTVKFEEGLTPPAGAVASVPAGGNTNDLPPGHPPIAGMGGQMPAATSPAPSSPSAPVGELAIRWSAPDHWISKELTQLRKASYNVHGTGTQVADFSIISLPGAAGGFHDNVNRWRGQIGLEPQDAATIDAGVNHMDSAGLHFDVVEFASTGEDAQRVLGAFLTIHDETWFFKLTGPDAVVAGERNSFIQFLKTVRTR